MWVLEEAMGFLRLCWRVLMWAFCEAVLADAERSSGLSVRLCWRVLGATPSHEGLVIQSLSFWGRKRGNPEIGRQPNVNGTFYKQNLVTENQLSASWKGTPAKS